MNLCLPPRPASMPRGKRILVWFWSHGGGGSQFAANLAYRLGVEFGHDRVVLSLASHDPTVVSARARGVEVRTADIVSDRRRPLESIIGLAKSANTIAQHAHDCDVLIAAMNFATLAPLSTTISKPLVYCAHDPSPHAGDYAAFGQRVTQSWLLKRADQVVALSNYAADILRADPGVAARLRVAPLSSVFEPREAQAKRDGPLRFLFAGRMIAYKGLDLLADALDLLPPSDLWRLTIAGTGPALTGELTRRLTRRGAEVFDRRFSEAELAQLFAESDVILAPYIEASQSGVVSDGLAAGKPCVVTAVGGLPEQIGFGSAGWIARERTSAALARTIELAVYDDQARVNLSAGSKTLGIEFWKGNVWGWLDQFLA